MIAAAATLLGFVLVNGYNLIVHLVQLFGG
jgi:flagellar biosynthesis protein FliP